MRADVERADRDYAVREEARAWHAAGAIEDGAMQAIERDHPDDRKRLRLPLRIAAGVMSFIGGWAVVGLMYELFRPSGRFASTTMCLGLGAAFAVATEWQLGPRRRAQAGVEYACGLFAAIGISLAILETQSYGHLAWCGLACAVVWSLLSWRWGFALFAPIGVLFALAGASTLHHTALACAVGGAAAAAVDFGFARSQRLAPSHRRALVWGSTLAIAAGYVGVISLVAPSPLASWIDAADLPNGVPRLVTLAVLLVVPAAAFALAVRRRDTYLFVLGILFVAGSAVTIRRLYHVVPAWMACLAGGAATLAVAILARRALERSPEREWRGLTADPLYSGGQRKTALAHAAATVAAFTPAAHAAPGERFGGGGGASGGGGATGVV